MNKKKTNYINLKHARAEDQLKQMEQIAQDGVCPFCREHFEKYHKSPIEINGKFWLLTKNDFPYDGTEVHFLIVYKTHIVNISDVESSAWIEFGEHIKFLNKKYKTPGGAIFIRFGNTDYTGSSINHLHAHFLIGGPYSENTEGIKVKLGYKKL